MVSIKGWSADRILTLPDRVFGRRWVVSCFVAQAGLGDSFDMSEAYFPETCVLWEVGIVPVAICLRTDYIRVAVGDQLPASEAEMMTLRPFLRGFGAQGPEPREIFPGKEGCSIRMRPRTILSTGTCRLILQGHGFTGYYQFVHVWAVVSSVPSEVAEWAVSGMEASR